MADPRFGEQLDQAWDAVKRGDQDAGVLDPALTETLRRLHALDHVPPPDPVFVRAVRKELLSAATIARAVDPDVGRSPNGRTLPALWWRGQGMPVRSAERRSWALAHVVTALLLLVTLLAAYIAFGPGHPHPAVAPTVAPIMVATPQAGVTVAPLGSATADELPAEPAWLMTFHSTFRPGGRYSMELSEGPDLIAVRSGAMTYHADLPITVLRAVTDAGPRAREVIPADTDAMLQAGDAALIPMGANVSRQNDGTEPAVEIMTMLEGTFLGSRGRGAPTSVVDLPIVTFHISDAHALPPAPVTITLSQVTLAPGATLPPPVAAWWMIGTSEEDYASLEQQPDGVMANTGTAPVTLYLTTLASVSGGAAVP